MTTVDSTPTPASSRPATRHTKSPKYAPPIWGHRPGVLTNTLRVLAFVILIALVLFPFLVVISTSISSRQAIDAAGGLVVIPTDVTLEAYTRILNGGVVTQAVLVSVFVAAVGTTLSLTITTLAAYALSRPGTLWHRGLLTMVLLTFLFSPGIIPLYVVVRTIGLLDNLWALILPTCLSAFNLVIVRGFIQNLPQELFEAARIDGASEWRILTSLAIPLSKSVLAVVGLFYGVGYWNAFFNAMLYLQDSSKWPLQLVLRAYVLQGTPLANDTAGESPPPQQAIQMAVVVIAIIPVLCVYPFVQRHLTKGVLTGALKG
ncbi:MAG TPA: carbohydrate ABC transporter permease [Candidatus Avipropionibacterium avicola]|uniref:Carbohydrate ABC transporter permease n=1 Tax=Candidatus Avipropionibacterium avicola TaxID=2840701 RepID=A0A9D1H030_9ACTN|nr:carbohydrate ABC transporter permease [Candidatus Avipropionibacterium avicola]